jgi:hypothetical protein
LVGRDYVRGAFAFPRLRCAAAGLGFEAVDFDNGDIGVAAQVAMPESAG